MRVLSIVLVICGLLLLIYGGVTLLVPKDVVNIGSVSINIHENLAIPLPPVAGAIFLILGVIMIMSAPALPPYPPPY